ncbi:amino acid transporter [Penicillium citrinum]|uniref:Amino acid transporter n=1 Tax=Penicillium citrinum TaxID=5077 RepID=A0A9W9N9Y4_PENCI|nr:amino acid transporter [Penicillium citrinum]KAJ5215168.1 amino acid transporter [Penicillium citrinum]
MSKIENDPEAQTKVQSAERPFTTDNATDQDVITEDAVFGTITTDGPNYRNIGWLGTSVLMMKAQIGLGVLSLPAAFNTLGLIPGIVSLLVLAHITTWGSYELGIFKLNHPEMYGYHDSMGLVFGRVGYEIMTIAFALFLVFCCASGLLSISIALNAISTHATCTAAFVAVPAVTVFCLASIRTMGSISWLAWVGMGCIFVALLTITIGVGTQGRPESAPATPGPWRSDWQLVAHPSFTEAISAVTAMVFALTGSPFFFAMISEMRDPRQYQKALFLCQGFVVVTFITIGVVTYYYCGSYVASPVLGSAGKTVKVAAYAVALPGLCVSATLSAHTVSKFFFVRILRGSRHLSSNTFVHWATWFVCVGAAITVAYLIASGIPIFDRLVSLVGALLGTLMVFQPLGVMWLYDNWSIFNENRTMVKTLKLAWVIFVIMSGTFLMIAGTYGAIVGVVDAMNANEGTRPWSCSDNSNSV